MDEKNIIEITSEGLLYLDEHKQKQFIDFAARYQRYLDNWNDPDHIKRFKEINQFFSDEELENSLKGIREYKEIGGRDFTVPLISFHTDPLIEFRFSSRDEYDKIVYFVRKTGLKLRDLT
jgi:hypothetical protein